AGAGSFNPRRHRRRRARRRRPRISGPPSARQRATARGVTGATLPASTRTQRERNVTEPVLVRERRGSVLVLRLNRPEARNALSGELVSELGLGFDYAEQDPAIRCVVLTGSGDRAFCAGMDLAAFAAGSAGEVDPRGTAAFGRFVAGGVTLPVVGAAQATAVAGGFELLLACDVVVASDAAKFGLPEVK